MLDVVRLVSRVIRFRHGDDLLHDANDVRIAQLDNRTSQRGMIRQVCHMTVNCFPRRQTAHENGIEDVRDGIDIIHRGSADPGGQLPRRMMLDVVKLVIRVIRFRHGGDLLHDANDA